MYTPFDIFAADTVQSLQTVWTAHDMTHRDLKWVVPTNQAFTMLHFIKYFSWLSDTGYTEYSFK